MAFRALGKIIGALFLVAFAIVSPQHAQAQNQTARVTPGGTWYYEYLPPDYNANTNNYPIVFFLHGIGERGDTETDLANVAKIGPPKYVKAGHKFPFILISPQLKKSNSLWTAPYIDEVIEYCKTYLRVDLSRVYLTGLSLGGGGTWTYSQDPVLGQKLAAVAVICGGYNDPKKACNFGINNIPVWAFHGDKDNVVTESVSIRMVDAINACNPAPSPLAKLTIYEGVAHNAWDNAFRIDNQVHTPNVYEWLLGFRNNGLVVSAGADQTINTPTNSTTIRGTASIPNGTITSYAWTKVSGPSVTMSNQSSSTLSLTGLVEGVYTFRLTARASNGESAYDDVRVTVVRTNQSPVANAGSDRTLTLPTNSVTINGSGSDPDGSITSYQWAKVSGPSATISGANTATLGLTNLVEGIYVFALTVNDNQGATATDRVTITVNPAAINQPPIANAGADKTINLPMSSTTLTGAGSDPDGTITSYIWEKISGPAVTLTNTTSATLRISDLAAGVFVFRLTVTDNAGASGWDEVTMTVIAANAPPVANAGADVSITLPTNSTNLNGSGSDADGSITSYSWTQTSGPSTASISNRTAAVASVSGLLEGTYVFRLTVTDDKGATSLDDMRVIVNAAATNKPPVANAGEDRTIYLPTTSITLSGSGRDDDGSIVSYLWVKTSGPSALLNNASTPVLGVSNLEVGVYRFQLRVTDNNGAEHADDVTITVVATNQSPVANAGTDLTVTLPTNFVTLTGAGTDADGSIRSYQWTKISGPSSGVISSPSNAETVVSDLVEGVYTFELVVTDNLGAIGSDEVVVHVQPAGTNTAPVVNAGSDRILTLPDNAITLTAAASDSDGTIVTYQWNKRSGPSCSLSGETTSALAVSAMIAGEYIFRVTVTDNNGATARDDVKVTVHPQIVNQAPSANAGSDKVIRLPENSTTITGTASDPDGTITGYQWTKVSGPAATMGGQSNAMLELSGLVEGVYTFRLTVTDNHGAVSSDDVVVTVSAANAVPIANAGPDLIMMLPQNSATITGSGVDPDGNIAAFSWTQVSGPAEATMTVSNGASIDVTNLIAGVYTFRLVVTDNSGATSSDEVKVTVNSGNQAPIVAISTNRNITLPNNRTTFSATARDDDGSIAGYQWTQLSGPEEAALQNATTATLSVTANTPGTYWFRITVIDNAGTTAYADGRLIVNAASVNIAPIAQAGNDRSITLPVNAVTLNGSGSDADGSIEAYQWIKVSGPAATMANTTTANASISGMVEGTYVFRLTVTDNRGSSGADEVVVNVLPAVVNQPPVANAGADITLTLPTNSVNIVGSGTDADGSISTFVWTKLSGPSVTITNDNRATVSLSNLLAGIYTFRLTVTDNSGATAMDEITVTVNAAEVNQAPTANAGPDKTLTLPVNVLTITGTGSDRDGSIVNYRWTKVSGPAAVIAGESTATLSLSELVEGSYVFRLTVTDNGGLTHRDDVRVIVLAANTNQSPVANAGPDKTITLPLNMVTIQGTGSDPDGSVTMYEWSKISGPAAVLTNSNSAVLTAANLVSGTYVFRLKVTDDKGAIDTDDVRIIVQPENSNQLPIANAGKDQTVTLPTSITTLVGSGSDTDGSIVRYSWVKLSGPPATLTNADRAAVSISGLVEGVYVFELEVEDNRGAIDTDDVQVTVLSETVNQAPEVNAGPDRVIVSPASSVVLTGTATDFDGSINQTIWSQGAGAICVIQSPGSLSTTVTGLAEGSYRFRLTATDNGGATAFDEVIVNVVNANANQPPVANAGPDQTIKLPRNSMLINGSGYDPDGSVSAYYWEKVSGPLVVMDNIQAPTLSLSEMRAGTYWLRLSVTDNQGARHEDLVKVMVLPADFNLPPVVNAGPDRSIGAAQTELILTGTVGDEEENTVSVFWEQISGTAVQLTGTNELSLQVAGLTQEGLYVFRLTATDHSGLTASDDVRVSVLGADPVSDPPILIIGNDIEIQFPENSVTIQANASSNNGFIASYHWQQTDGTPLNFDTASEDVLVLENLQPGVYRLILTVTDYEGRTASEEIVITVLEENPEIRPRKLFSPDRKGDMTSETWTIENAQLLDNCEIVVYNREGQKVYASIGYPIPWDGTYYGNPVPDGAYYYVIRKDGKIVKKGSVTIARLK